MQSPRIGMNRFKTEQYIQISYGALNGSFHVTVVTSVIGISRQLPTGSSNKPSSAQILIRWRIMYVCQKNEQKQIKPGDKLIYSIRSRPTVHRRIREKNNARTSTKPLCGSSKRLL